MAVTELVPWCIIEYIYVGVYILYENENAASEGCAKEK